MGFLSDLWGSFTGDAQRDEIRSAGKKADKYLDDNYQAARDDYTGAIDSFQSYADAGTKSQKFYDDLMGLNGPEARAAAQATVTSDPQFGGQLASNSNAMLRYLNARGESGGGKAQLAGQRVLQGTYGDWINRYKSGGEQGLQATNAMAAYRGGRGDLAWGYGTTKAGKAINQGNAMAEAQGIGINNLLKVGELGVKSASAAASAAAAMSDIHLKTGIRKLGALPSGLPFYAFRYVWGGPEQIGVMAQEAREVFPEAVIEHPSGFLMVDYSRIC